MNDQSPATERPMHARTASAQPALTKNIRVVLRGLTAVEYVEVLQVPADLSASDLDRLVDERYSAVDGGDFQGDPEYWERGDCRHEAAAAGDVAQGIVTVANGNFSVSTIAAAAPQTVATTQARADEALALFEQMDQQLESMQAGSAATGRWLDGHGHECDETDPGATWTPYDLEEQQAWLETVASDLAELKRLAQQLRQLVAPRDATIIDQASEVSGDEEQDSSTSSPRPGSP